MDKRFKIGAGFGVLFAGLAYLVAQINGFNSSSFSLILYLYVVLGVVSRFRLEDAVRYLESLENVVWIKEEEKKLKKIFTGEEYEVDGTVKKVQ